MLYHGNHEAAVLNTQVEVCVVTTEDYPSLSIQGILLYCMVAHSVSAGLSCGLMQAVLSLDELMGRFRANLIIKGDAPPFVEDTWTELSIGDFHFEVRSLHPHVCIHTYIHV